MEKQLVGVGNILDVKQFHKRVALGVEMLVHVFQNALDANLLTVANRPHGIKRQAFRHGTFKNENRRCARPADEIDSLRIERGNGLREHGVVPAIEQSDAVRANQRTAVLLAGVENLLFQKGSLVGFLAESGRYDDERANLFFLGKEFDVLRTEFRGHNENGQIGRRKVFRVVKHFDALHFVFFRIDDAKRAFIAAAQQVAHDGATGFVHVVRAADDDNALRMQ